MSVPSNAPTGSPSTMRWGITALVIFVILVIAFYLNSVYHQGARTRVQATSSAGTLTGTNQGNGRK